MKLIQNRVKKWLGLHNDATGDASLKPGELSAMKNFQIGKGYVAQKRRGYTQEFYTTQTGVTATNLIKNPHFETDASDYTFTNITKTVADDALTLVANATNGLHYMVQDVDAANIVATHIYYLRMEGLLIDGGGTLLVGMKNRKSTGSYTTVTSSPIYKQGHASCLIAVSSVYSTPSLQLFFYVSDVTGTLTNFAGVAQRVVASEPMFVDLTDLYGAGNEPTLDAADDVFSTWFPTTDTVDIVIDSATGAPIDGQWHGTLNGVETHLFASNGNVYVNDGDHTYTSIGTLTYNGTQFFQFEDTKGIEQRQAGTHYDLGEGSSTTKIGQSFTPARDMKVTAVTMSIRAKTIATTDNVRCKLYLNDSATGDTLLATAANVINGATMTTEANFFTPCVFYFDSVALTEGESYLISLERTGSVDSTNYFEVAFSSSNQIAGGTNFSYDGSTWSAGSGDLWFKVAIKPQYSIYIVNGVEYKKWTGFGNIQDVVGYIPIVMTSTTPAGVGTALEGVNTLSNKKRQFFNGDGSTMTFQLCETNLTSIDYIYLNGVGAGTYTTDLDAGTITLTVAPPDGINNVEIQWTSGSKYDADILAKTNFELYGGKNDNRVFLFGNDSVVFYSGLANGSASAEYFPVLNYIRVGSSETTVTDLAKHFDRLIIFKEDSTYWSSYEYDSSLGVQFPVYPLNDAIGCSQKGTVQIIDNNPWTVHRGKIYQLVASNVRDERNMVCMSDYIQGLLDERDFTGCITFDNQAEKEYWLILENTKIFIYNYGLKVWYYYETIPWVASIVYTDEVTFGDFYGFVYKFDKTCVTDNLSTIEAYMETGNMDYGTTMYRKLINYIWVTLFMVTTTSLNIYYQMDNDLNWTLIKEITDTDSALKTIISRLRAKNFVFIKFKFENNARNSVTITGLDAPANITTITHNRTSSAS